VKQHTILHSIRQKRFNSQRVAFQPWLKYNAMAGGNDFGLMAYKIVIIIIILDVRSSLSSSAVRRLSGCGLVQPIRLRLVGRNGRSSRPVVPRAAAGASAEASS